MQAQAVLQDQSWLVLERWCDCQSLNQDSAILLQAEDLVFLLNQQNAEYIEKI